MSSDQRTNQYSGRKPRNYYVDYTKRGGNYSRGGGRGGSHGGNHTKFPEISYGLRGFLITALDEVKCYLEMRNIFEGYFEQINGADSGDKEPKTGDKPEMTTEDEIESELKQLRTTRPFRQVKTHCRNSIFITINKEYPQINPIKMVDSFFNEMDEKKEVRTRNTFKVLPILDTFRNTPACARDSVMSLLQTSFKDETGPKKFFIEFQSRGNYKLDSAEKTKMVQDVANAVTQVREDWTVSREEADYIIVLVALRDVCCVSFLKDYFKRSKYNVTEFCKEFAPLPQTEEEPQVDQPTNKEQAEEQSTA